MHKFEIVPEDTRPPVKLDQIELPAAVFERLKTAAEEKGVSQNKAARQAIEFALDALPNKKAIKGTSKRRGATAGGA